ncbi:MULTISPECIES: hypothetical protein [unclassified Arthrobacter]|uniref:hypothetical protein n=1 Tax=unclassified Arthrobacter TaxID=235627 RepID=UPI001C84FB41|nr:hypothetical protein [Arthrobacter sp. MAHUQ-56]MBX7443372.1 hypothetical protein [Arthrobacter sp. MAHUQ-56]
MAVSKPFDTKADAVEGIAAVREYAGMGLISDNCQTTIDATRLDCMKILLVNLQIRAASKNRFSRSRPGCP